MIKTTVCVFLFFIFPVQGQSPTFGDSALSRSTLFEEKPRQRCEYFTCWDSCGKRRCTDAYCERGVCRCDQCQRRRLQTKPKPADPVPQVPLAEYLGYRTKNRQEKNCTLFLCWDRCASRRCFDGFCLNNVCHCFQCPRTSASAFLPRRASCFSC